MSGRTLVLGGVAAAVTALSVAVPGTAEAAAPPAADCAWAGAAARLAASLGRSSDPRAAGIRGQLQRLGFGADGVAPAGCAAGGSGGTTASAPAGPDQPLHGKAEKGLFTDTGSTGKVIAVDGGSIGAADPAPGDTVEIAAGTYQGFTPKSGSNGAYVTYRAAPGAKVIISGGGGEGVIDLSNVSFVHLDGMTVQNAPSYGIYGSGAKNIALTNMAVDTSQNGGMVILQSDTVHIEGCEIYKSNNKGTSADNEALSIGLGTTNFEVFNCKVHENGEEGIDAKYDAKNGSIHDNLVWGNRGPNIYIDSAVDIDVHDNYVWGATESSKAGIGLAVENYSETKKISGIDVHGNTLWDNAGGGVSCWVESSGEFSGVVVRDNTLAGGDQVRDCARSGVSAAGNVDGAVPQAVAALAGTVPGGGAPSGGDPSGGDPRGGDPSGGDPGRGTAAATPDTSDGEN